MTNPAHSAQFKNRSGPLLNQWDLLILIFVFGLFAAFVWGAQQMTSPYALGEKLPISLEPGMLPMYALRTVIRMAIALALSLLVTFIFGTLAAKSRRAERIILPLIDILQSVPVLGFLSITIIGFIMLFPNSLLGPECAAIFAIFTAQVWNMILSFYQSLRTIPKDLQEAANVFRLSPWKRFWRLEVPYAMPPLIWNVMISLSAGWFFVVASEAITVNNQEILLPGIGSYIHIATLQSNYTALAQAIFAMFVVILIYDQLIFHPLIVWSEKFKHQPNQEIEGSGTWFLNLLHRARLTYWLHQGLNYLSDLFSHLLVRHIPHRTLPPRVKRAISWSWSAVWQSLVLIMMIASLYYLALLIHQHFTLHEITHTFWLGLITAFKIAILIIIASMIWIPVGVWIGLRPRFAPLMQPIVQFLAAFPVNVFYPIAFMLIFTFNLNIEVWSSLLMILGTQWYILFNVIAGASTIPHDLHLATQNYGVTGWAWWRSFILPGIFPYYVTGAMAAAGGCWNASILADVVQWGDKTLRAQGLGGYIDQATQTGDFARIALGIAVMCLYVVVINRLLWSRLYQLAEERFHV